MNRLIISGVLLLLAACGTSKKQTTTTPLPASPLVYKTPATGMYAPGEEELAAVRTQFADVTSQQLTEGYTLYTEGACIKCHQAKNIYNFSETSWKGIIDDMAKMANISYQQKDAVYRYVLSIKAMQASKTGTPSPR